MAEMRNELDKREVTLLLLKRILLSWKSVTVVLVGASVLRLHYDVCAHKSLCQDCFCGPSNMRMSCLSLSLCTEHWSYWLRELIPAGELVYWSSCTWWNVIFLLRLTSMPGEAYVQNCSVSRVGKAITTNTPTCTKRKAQTLRIVDLGESCKYHQHHIHYHYNFKLYSP